MTRKIVKRSTFLACTTPIDRIGGENQKYETTTWGFEPGTKTSEQAFEYFPFNLAIGGVPTGQLPAPWTSNPKVLGSTPLWDGCLYFDSHYIIRKCRNRELKGQFLPKLFVLASAVHILKLERYRED